MDHLITVTRMVGVLVGLAFGMGVYFGVLGPLYSEDMPSLGERILHSLPLAGMAAILLVPQSLFLRGRRYWILLGAYTVVCAYLLFLTVQAAWLYGTTDAGGEMVTIIVAVFVAVLSNGCMLPVGRAQLPPNNSFKPTPLRGAA